MCAILGMCYIDITRTNQYIIHFFVNLVKIQFFSKKCKIIKVAAEKSAATLNQKGKRKVFTALSDVVMEVVQCAGLEIQKIDIVAAVLGIIRVFINIEIILCVDDVPAKIVPLG